MDILEHLGMKVPDIEGHGVIISRASGACLIISLLLIREFDAGKTSSHRDRECGW